MRSSAWALMVLGLLCASCASAPSVEHQRRQALRDLTDPESRDSALRVLARLALYQDGDAGKAHVYLSRRAMGEPTAGTATVEALVASARGDLKGEIAAWTVGLSSPDPGAASLALHRLLLVEDYVPRPATRILRALERFRGQDTITAARLQRRLQRRPWGALAVRLTTAEHALPLSAFVDGRIGELLARRMPAAVEVRDGWLHLENRKRAVARVEIEVPKSARGTWLRVTSRDAFEVRVAGTGTTLLRRDPSRGYPAQAQQVWLRPGPPKVLFVDLAAQSAEARIGIHWIEGQPDPVATGAEPSTERLLAAAERAAERRDRDAVQQHLEALEARAPALTAARVLAARALGLRGRRLQHGFAELGADRGHAAVVRAQAVEAHATGRDQEAHRRVAPLLAVRDPRSALAAQRILQDRGWEEAAREALTKATALAPTACEPVRVRVMLDWTRLKLRRSDLMRQFPAGCARLPRITSMLAQFDAEIGNKAQALARMEAADNAASNRPASGTVRLRLLERLGRTEEARRLARRLAEADPARDLVGPKFRLGDLLAVSGDSHAARSTWAEAARQGRGDQDIRLRLMALGAGRVWEKFRPDIEASLREPLPEDLVRGRPAVLLIDHQTSLRFRDGSAVQHIHQVMRLLTPAAVEELGEAKLRPNTWVLRAATRKKGDGRSIEPEDIIEKEAVSFPDLEVGDAIELEYLEPQTVDTELGGEWVEDPFYFQLFDIPTWRASYAVLLQTGVAGRFAAHPALAPPEKLEADGFHGWRWSMQGTEAARAEPLAVAPRDVLPRVQVWSGWGWSHLVRLAREDLLRLAAPDRRLRRLAKRLAPSDGDRLAGLRAIYGYVVTEIHETSDAFLDVPAAKAIATGRGERAIALFALLLAAGGYDAELAMVDPVHRHHAPWEVPQVRDHTALLVRARLPGAQEHVWLDPTFMGTDPGFLSPTVRGRPAWVLGPGGVTGRATTPVGLTAVDETRRIQVELHIGSDGAIGGRWREEAHGMDAVVYRDGLARLTEPERIRVFGDLAQELLPGSAVGALLVQGLEPTDPQVDVRYDVVRKAGPAGPGTLRLGLVPLSLSRRFILTPERGGPLYADRNEHVDLSIEIRLAPGLRVQGPLPKAVHHKGLFGTYERTVTETEGGLRVQKTFHMLPQIVQPGAYALFRRYCRTVDEADRIQLQLERHP